MKKKARSKERVKIMQAGDLVYMIQYTSLQGGVSKDERCARYRISSAVRESMNFRTSKQKLHLILESTFDPQRDLFITLTYSDEHLPKRREDADRKLSYFLRAVREHRAKLGQETVYVRVTEGRHGKKRFHHHLLINGTGDDYALFASLWQWGQENEFLPYSVKTHWQHAEYLTKESKEPGSRRVGERMWRCSRNVKRPIIIYDEAPAGSQLAVPPEYYVEETDQKDNVYGRFQYAKCRKSGKAQVDKFRPSK